MTEQQGKALAWAKAQQVSTQSELEAACLEGNNAAASAAADKLVRTDQLIAVLAPRKTDSKLGFRQWLLLLGISSAIVVALLSFHPAAGAVSVEAASRGLRLSFPQEVILSGEDLAFIGYDMTEVSGALEASDARSGMGFPLSILNQTVGMTQEVAIARIAIARGDELALEIFGDDTLRLSILGTGSSVDFTLNGSAVSVLDSNGDAIAGKELYANNNIRITSAGQLNLLLQRREGSKPDASFALLSHSGPTDFISFDKRSPVSGQMVGRTQLLESAKIAFLDFGDEQRTPLAGQAFSIVQAVGPLDLSADSEVITTVFNGRAGDVGGETGSITPAALHWLWKNSTVTFLVGAVLSVLGFLMASRDRIRAFFIGG